VILKFSDQTKFLITIDKIHNFSEKCKGFGHNFFQSFGINEISQSNCTAYTAFAFCNGPEFSFSSLIKGKGEKRCKVSCEDFKDVSNQIRKKGLTREPKSNILN